MKKIPLLIKDERGVITVMTIIMMVAFLGIMALVIDLGHLYVVQNELRNAADACALRGARAFYADSDSPSSITEDSVARGSAGIPQAQALETVSKNYTDTAAFPLQNIENVAIGVWYFDPPSGAAGWWGGANTVVSTPDFSLWDPTNKDLYGKVIGPGIRLNVNRTGGDNYGPVGMSLARLFQASVDVITEATAALSPLGEVGKDNWDDFGKPPPLQIGDQFAMNPGSSLTLAPDNTDAGGWQSYYGLKNPNTNTLRDLIWGRQNPPDLYAGSASSGGTPIERSNGVNATLFDDNPSQQTNSLYWRWMTETGRTAAGLGPDDPAPGDPITGEPKVWSVTLPVTSSAGPFVGTAEILGFSKVDIIRVYPAGYKDPITGSGAKAKTIDVKVGTTTWAGHGTGGGKYYGMMAVTPVIVK